MSRRMHVFAIDPFHGGSHRAFIRGLASRSRHRWDLFTGRPVHWKWRMRSAPIQFAQQVRAAVAKQGMPDFIFCTDMLDLPTFRGLVSGVLVDRIPTAIYFHENQWTYPKAPAARTDFHYGYTNLLSAIAADECWFNSRFHRDDFLTASEHFVHRMPDGYEDHDFIGLAARCRVIAPGFDDRPIDRDHRSTEPLSVGWVSRWEHDKRPDRLIKLLRRLESRKLEYGLILLGSRPSPPPPELIAIEREFGARVKFSGFAESDVDYWDWLTRMDCVVSTADHEFFGIAICEAIWAGAVPVLPKRLSYPELAGDECLYESLDEAAELIIKLSIGTNRQRLMTQSRAHIRSFSLSHTVGSIDDRIERLVAGTGAGKPNHL